MKLKSKNSTTTYPKTFQTKLGLNEAIKIEMKSAMLCQTMAENGFPLDKAEAHAQIAELTRRIEETEATILPLIPAKPKAKGTTVTKLFKLNGEHTAQVLKWKEENDVTADVDGQFTRIEWNPINLNSPVQVNNWLLKNGWQPKEWNYKKDKRGKEIRDAQGNKIKTSPKLTDESLEDLEELGEAAKLIALRRKYTHKRNQIEGFLRNCRADGRVPSEVNTIGAATRRMTHKKIANVPKPNDKAFWPYMRKMFYAGDPEWTVVGCDASQIQIRGLGHYAAVVCNNYQLIDDLVSADNGEGPDVHTLNGQRSGTERDESKGIFYGYLFGAGVPKTAKQLGKSVKETEKIRKKFDEAVPFVGQIVDYLVKFYRTHGYITGLDGVKIYAESEHMLLVYLLQNFEAVFMKVALCYADNMIKAKGLRAQFVTMQHDEFQFIAHKDDAEQVGAILEESMQKAGVFVGSLCPVVGEAKIGPTWYHTH